MKREAFGAFAPCDLQIPANVALLSPARLIGPP